ncbi:unnamed protein product [Dibothriocephalus latus]|uniref:Uncharacterized protein n=1 Tax=Dibothriocephalus latus TaxID=60516 RepID=A0A3P6QYQ7_DIBLA|nr:unnamed protein product [Dibothriocephalus latus]
MLELPTDIQLVLSLTNYRRAVTISELASRAGLCHVDLTHWPSRQQQQQQESMDPRPSHSTIWTGLRPVLHSQLLENLLKMEDVHRGVELIADMPEQGRQLPKELPNVFVNQ